MSAYSGVDYLRLQQPTCLRVFASTYEVLTYYVVGPGANQQDRALIPKCAI